MKVKYSEIDLKLESKSDIIFLKNGPCWFCFSQTHKSRYFGGYLYFQNKALKFLDDLEFNEKIQEVDFLSPHEVILDFETYQSYLNLDKNFMEIKFSSTQEFKIYFDIKDIFRNEPFERSIEIERLSSNCLILNEFLKDDGFIKILLESDGVLNFNNNWVRKFNNFDQKRNSPPYEWYVFDGVYGKGKELKIKIIQPEISNSPKNVINLEKVNRLKENKSIVIFFLARINSLILDSYLPAGLPWFYENWFRDELLSLYFIKNFIDNNFFEQRIKFYLHQLEKVWDKNKLSNNDSPATVDTFPLIVLSLPTDIFLSHFHLLENYLQLWQKNFDLDNLPPYSTWMDTLSRKSALEIESFYLKVLRRFAKFNKNYIPLANDLKRKIVKKIIQNPGDINLVFAYLFLEDIFSIKEWCNIFENFLKETYLEWGGIASLPKNDPHFHLEDDGEISSAYHRGNAWYYLNNLYAYALNKIDASHFKEIINKIIMSSLTDTFLDGALGWSSEISSAKKRESNGCLIQLWSISSLLFLLSSFQNLDIFLKSLSNSHNIITVKS